MDKRAAPQYHPFAMPFLLRNISVALDESEDVIVARAAKRLGVPLHAIRHYAIVRRSLDARRRDAHFSYHVEVALDEPPAAERARFRRLRRDQATWIEPPTARAIVAGAQPLAERPIVVGFGPAGMFAALQLAEHGYRPIVLERGRGVRRRHYDVMQRFYREGIFDDTSNLLFGEGGAGTYSDGKLYTRIRDPLCRNVLEMLYRHGADPDILIDNRPHIGSDRLPTICTRIRERIESLGGEVRFEERMVDIRLREGQLEAIRLHSVQRPAADRWINAGPVLLGTGHSARDTVAMLHARGITLEPRAFQLGVRIEHPQTLVDGWQYGTAAGHRRLDPAEYHVVANGAACEHGDMFSFCMCPGGSILPTNESAGLIATNGASNANRSSPFANSGLVITLDPTTMADEIRTALGKTPGSGHRLVPDGDTPGLALAALAYQRHWERTAFELTDRTYRVPCQRASDFLGGRMSDGALETSYPLGGAWANIADIVPVAVAEALHRALPMLNDRFPDFAGDDAIITGPETRASAPYRIVRDPTTRESVSCRGLFPMGEGAGYAGGIISAAVDGMKSATVIISRYAPIG